MVPTPSASQWEASQHALARMDSLASPGTGVRTPSTVVSEPHRAVPPQTGPAALLIMFVFATSASRFFIIPHIFSSHCDCPQGCRSDTECALGERCISNTEDSGPNEKVCIKICFYDAHCLAGEYCEENVCRPGCRSDSNCPFGQVDSRSNPQKDPSWHNFEL